MTTKIEVYIERLLLDGLPLDRVHAKAVHAAVEQELTRLLTQGGLPRELQTSRAVPAMRSPEIPLENKPVSMGTRIASAVHSAISADGGRRDG